MAPQTGFFDEQGPGGPVWIQHIVWLLGHPEVLLFGFLIFGAIAWMVFAHYWGQLRLRPVPLLFLGSGALYATIHGVLGLWMNRSSIDQMLHDTYYITAHYRFGFAVTVAFIVFAAYYSLFERLFRTCFKNSLAIAQWFSFTAAVCLILLPQYVLSFQGMPRRYSEYAEPSQAWQIVSATGYFATLISALLFVICIGEAIYRRKCNTDIHLDHD